MSQQQPQQSETPKPEPSWWVKAIVTAFIGTLFTSFSSVLALLGTGILTIGHIGVLQVIIAVVISLACGIVGYVLGVRTIIFALYAFIEAIFSPKTWSNLRSDPADSPDFYKDKPPTTGDRIFNWLFTPKKYRKLFPPSKPR